MTSESMQAGQTAFAAEQLGVALYWFKLVRTWAPASLQAEVDVCEAAGAVPAIPVGPLRCGVLMLGS